MSVLFCVILFYRFFLVSAAASVGTEQFFMDDTSRNGEAHYGLGLFFAKTVADKYGGGLKLSNSENTGGARVEIFFLSSQETS